MQTNSSANLQELDPQQFGSLVKPYRRELRAHSYRMLSSVREAEEIVQETFLHAWSRRDTCARRATLRTWQHKIATNLCIDTQTVKLRRALSITREPASPVEVAHLACLTLCTEWIRNNWVPAIQKTDSFDPVPFTGSKR